MDTNTATIISGILSMAGGLAGAFGAYFVASKQIKKQFERKDKDRVIELKIEKLNETLEKANDFAHNLNLWTEKNLEIVGRVEEKIKTNTHLSNKDVFEVNDLEFIQGQILVLTSLKGALKKNRIFLPTSVNLNDFIYKNDLLLEYNKDFINLFDNLKKDKTIDINEKFIVLFDKKIDEIINSHNNLNDIISKIITKIEIAIKELL